MKWLTKLASTPPAYLTERISDLSYARKLCLTEPTKSISVLKKVASQFDQQLNPNFSDKVAQIIVMMRDSPMKAKSMIDGLIFEMRNTK
jgi:hypothetical protein